MTQAWYFDGKHAQAQSVILSLGAEELQVRGTQLNLRVPRQALRIAEPFAHGSLILYLPQGAHCEVHDGQAWRSLLLHLGYQASLVQRMQSSWRGAALALLLVISALLLARAFGLPFLADQITARVPAASEQRLGAEVFKQLEKDVSLASGKSAQEIMAAEMLLTRQLARIAPQTRLPLQVKLWHAPSLGMNAVSLPNGVIIMTEKMWDVIQAQPLPPQHKEDLLAAVLAHEVAHIQARHSLHNAVSTSLTGAMSWAVFGDFSGVAAGAVTMVVQSEYSRDTESEADQLALQALRRAAIPAERLAEILELLQLMQRSKSSRMPHWMRVSTDYLSTHPPYPERIAQIRAAK
ncbi:M48 family metallopeptidase [Massilia sp. W12]|uniref:M48 family metallopeptidase n=1 Tax=Massilia sp. W12 TaxID=3126507 RepID=UPI0030CFF45B